MNHKDNRLLLDSGKALIEAERMGQDEVSDYLLTSVYVYLKPYGFMFDRGPVAAMHAHLGAMTGFCWPE